MYWVQGVANVNAERIVYKAVFKKFHFFSTEVEDSSLGAFILSKFSLEYLHICCNFVSADEQKFIQHIFYLFNFLKYDPNKN